MTIEILNDTTDEDNETFSVTLSSAVGAKVGTATQVITITDNDGPPSISIGNGSTVEGSAGYHTPLPLTLTLSAASGKTVTVGYATNDGTAIVATDYLNATSQVTFAPGDITKTINMFAVGDAVREIDEAFTVTLSSPVNATIATGTATATILDDDRVAGPRKSDFNIDGKPDLLWRHDTTGNLAVWLMDGTTMTTTIAPTPNQSPPGLVLVGTGDFYMDGSPDIVWRDPVTGNVSIWIMSGLNRLWIEDITPQIGVPEWRAAAVADVNGDSHPDLIWRHTEGWVLVSMLVGRTMVALHILSPDAVSADWQLAGTGDMDQDGHTDLIWHNETNGYLVWWRLNGSVHVESHAMSPSAVENVQWRVRGAEDIDRDGMTDLLWQNTVTGEIAVWLMNGTTLRTSLVTIPGQLADLAWRLVAPK